MFSVACMACMTERTYRPSSFWVARKSGNQVISQPGVCINLSEQPLNLFLNAAAQPYLTEEQTK